jgi:perosamine synthetase
MIRLTVPFIGKEEIRAMEEVLSSGYLVQGSHVAAFEEAAARYVGVQYAVAVSSGTAALHLALLSLGVGPGDLVLVTAYSFVATANVIELCGARPVFADIRPDTFNMDPDSLKATLKRLSETNDISRVKAILPVHTFGQVADMPNICKLAEQYRLPIIEDAACALGATFQGQQAGTWGVMGCFSFHPRKAITTGEGGMIVTNDPQLNRRLRAMRNHGQDPETDSPDFILPGFNYRMTEFQGALGLCQLSKLNEIISARRQIAARYDLLLKGTDVEVPIVQSGHQHVYQSYVILLSNRKASQRDEIIKQMTASGIESSIGTYHIPLTTFFSRRYGFKQGDFRIAEKIFARSLSLPIYHGLSFDDQTVVHEVFLLSLRALEA